MNQATTNQQNPFDVLLQDIARKFELIFANNDRPHEKVYQCEEVIQALFELDSIHAEAGRQIKIAMAAAFEARGRMYLMNEYNSGPVTLHS
jgi:hypothetical protein